MNEVIFFGFTLFLLIISLIAFRFGKAYIFLLIGLFSVIMNIFVTKQFTLFGLAITGGNALYGATFLLTDILSEHYGKRDAYRAVGVGFLSMLIFVVSTQVLLLYVPNEFDFADPALQTIFALTPRILFGSLLAYAIAQSFDVWWYHVLRGWTKGKLLFVRNNASTWVSQFLDSVIFTAVGLTTFSFLPFEGIITPDIFWEVTLATYLVKIVVAFLDTPFLYLSYRFRPAELQDSKKKST